MLLLLDYSYVLSIRLSSKYLLPVFSCDILSFCVVDDLLICKVVNDMDWLICKVVNDMDWLICKVVNDMDLLICKVLNDMD
jgi:hypothetical protein